MFKRSLKSMLLACARLGSLLGAGWKKNHPTPSKSSSSWSDFRKTQMKHKLLMMTFPTWNISSKKKLEDMITFTQHIFRDLNLNCSFVLRNFPSMFFFQKLLTSTRKSLPGKHRILYRPFFSQQLWMGFGGSS